MVSSRSNISKPLFCVKYHAPPLGRSPSLNEGPTSMGTCMEGRRKMEREPKTPCVSPSLSENPKSTKTQIWNPMVTLLPGLWEQEDGRADTKRARAGGLLLSAKSVYFNPNMPITQLSPQQGKL